MSSGTYYFDNSSAQEEALQKAKALLKARGVHYPLYDPTKSAGEHLEALKTYGALEAKLYRDSLNIATLKSPSFALAGKSAIVPYTQNWGASYYDN
jgi:hypothetical protein